MGLRGTRLSAALVAAAGVAAAAGAQAAEWWLEPMVRGRTFYDDNFRLRTENEEAVWSVLVEPRIAGGRRIERAGISFDAGAQFRRYPGDSELDSNDQDVRLNTYYFSERNRFDLGLDVVRDTTLTSEIEETGLVQEQRRRTEVSLSPSWVRTLTERDSLQVSYLGQSVQYDAAPTEFIDYQYHSLTGTWLRRLDEKNELNLSAFLSRYEADNDRATIDTVGVQGGIDHEFSQTLSGTLLAGVRRSDSESLLNLGLFQIRTEDESTGGLFLAGLEKTFERGSVEASLTRSITPGSFGAVYQSDRLLLNAQRPLDSRRRISVRVSALRYEAVQGSNASRDRTAFRVRPEFHWKLSRELWASASFQYRWQEFENADEAASSSRIEMTLEYRWPRVAWSR